MSVHKPTVSTKVVIPAPYHVRGKLQPESRVPGENRDPVFEMVPDPRIVVRGRFRRDAFWMPPYHSTGQAPQVRHDGRGAFINRLYLIRRRTRIEWGKLCILKGFVWYFGEAGLAQGVLNLLTGPGAASENQGVKTCSLSSR